MRTAKKHGLPPLTLCTPFVVSVRLPELRKQACSLKDQADPMESLLGAIAMAAMQAAPHADPLATTLHATYGFFQRAILPPPPPPPPSGSTSAPTERISCVMHALTTLTDKFRHATKGEAMVEQAARLQAALLAGLPAGSPLMSFDGVEAMLHHCCAWNDGEVFERAEFLGDAFLQVAVSLELAHRYAKSHEGDLTNLRAALVCNLNLGRLLTRRFGIEMALGFFEGGERPSVLERKGSKGHAKLMAIRTYIQEVRLDEPRANLAEAVELLQQADGEKARVRAEVEAAAGPAEEDVEAQGDATSASHTKGGEDYRKPVGDMYEAIVGLMLCALEGDVAATWRYFSADFFPPEAEAREGEEEEAEAELQRALWNERKRVAKEKVNPTCAAQAGPVPGVEGGGGDPTGLPVAPASEPMKLDPPAFAEVAKRPRETETCAQPAPKRVSPTADLASAASIQNGTAALPIPAIATKRPGACSSNPIGPIGEVNQRLQQRLRCNLSKWLEETYCARGQLPNTSPFVCTLVHKRTGQVLATSSERRNKQEAKKDACERLLSNPAFDELIQEDAQPPPPQLQQLQPPPPPPPAQPPTASPPAMVAGVEVTPRSKHAASADVRGLYALVSNLARARPSETAATREEIAAALVRLQEKDPNFLKRLSGLAQASALPAFVLRGLVLKACELSLRPRPRPPETKRSGARLVQEALLEYIKQPMGLEESGCKLSAGDTVRIWGLTSEKHTELNGTTGEVVKWVAEKERFAVRTPAVRQGDFLVRPCNLELLHLSEERRHGLPAAAGQLAYYLQTAEDNWYDRSMLLAHGLELPLYLFHTYRRLREAILGEALNVPHDPLLRFRALQQAVRDAPSLALCGPRDDRVRRRIDLDWACAEATATAAAEDAMDLEMNPAAEEEDAPTTFDAMLLPATPGASPRPIQLARRLDFLHVLAERLEQQHTASNSTSTSSAAAAAAAATFPGGPLGMYARHVGQITEQPVLYFLIAPSAARNELASRLAGHDVHGDAILAAVELEEAADGGSALRCDGIPACERFLAEHEPSPLAFWVGKVVGFPLLSNWSVPRMAGFQCHHGQMKRPPKAVMQEWSQRPLVKTPRWDAEALAVHVDDQGEAKPQTPFYGRVYTDAWASGSASTWGIPPPEARRLDNGLHELESRAHSRTRKEAENEALLQLMRALSTDVPAPPLQIDAPLDLRTDGMDAGAVAGVDAGSAIRCSYVLRLAALVDTSADAAAGTCGSLAEGGVAKVVLEEQHELDVVLGCGLLQPQVESLLAEAASRWQACRGADAAGLRQQPRREEDEEDAPLTIFVPLRACYRGAEAACELEITVHRMSRSEEENLYELVGDSADGPLNVRRLEKLRALVHEFAPTSLADIGCGQGKLLCGLLGEGGLPPSLARLIGVDVNTSALRRAERDLRAALSDRGGDDDGAGQAQPSVRLGNGSLADLDAAALGGEGPSSRVGAVASAASASVDMLTLVEVVEHLDPPELAELGAALLGRCGPRVLIVTTPNREYNLNMMVRCCFPPGKCRGRAGGQAVDEKRRKEMVDDMELCPNCNLFCSGVRPAMHEYTKRTPDHRFEWTRSEFKTWAEELAGTFGYDVRFDGVCGGPFDEVRKAADVFHGPGPMSQVAIFTRQATASGAAQEAARHAHALGGGGAVRVVWDSPREADAEAEHAAPAEDDDEFMAFGENHEYRPEY